VNPLIEREHRDRREHYGRCEGEMMWKADPHRWECGVCGFETPDAIFLLSQSERDAILDQTIARYVPVT